MTKHATSPAPVVRRNGLLPVAWLPLLMALALSACSTSENGPVQIERIVTPKVRFIDGRPDPAVLAEKQILRKGNGSQPQTLDPHKAEGVPSSNILRDLFEGLTGESPDGHVVPAGAQSWDISEDGLTYTFHIRPDGRWSDGSPVTARDFEYGFKRSLNPATGSKYTKILSPIKNAEAVAAGTLPLDDLGVKALDDDTLRIELATPAPYFLGLLNHSSTYPMHRPSVEKWGEAVAKPGHLVSNGAYRLDELVVQSHIKLVRNPHYWNNDHTIIDEVWYYPIEDQSSELKRYRAGEIDYTYEVPNNQFKWIKKYLGEELVINPWLGIYYYGFNLTKPPFKDNLNLRKALAMAVDRHILTDKVTQFGERPAYAFVPPGVSNGVGLYAPQNPEWASWPREKQLAEAQRLYAEAGYSRTHPLEVELRYNTSENHKKIAIAVAAMWKQALGVKTRLINEEWKVFLSNRKQKQVTQVFRAGWISDYNDPMSFLELLHSQHGINDSAYSNPEYDRLLAQIAAEPDAEKRARLMEKAERLMLSEQPVMPLYSYVVKRLVKPYLGGVGSNIMDHHYSKDWYILKHRTEKVWLNRDGEEIPPPDSRKTSATAKQPGAKN